ncbi:flagellar basal-body MS-ring/collar protein FliF [Gallaecimonas mangrovi]|uniref:flagellar basal-body MS-ring/collar protein FliF n=1 Tax=Gallaecimonas mangrovi TaxID=2291597 RepID=UPI000E203065|nr:flagellar basal-body MS-ring/collar protein FliF [Gallaecimonas mangrovi]
MAELINSVAEGGNTVVDGVKSLAGRWRNISKDNRSAAVVALLAATVAAAIVLILWTSSRHYVPLYGSQEMYDKANIIENLEKEGIDFRLDGDSGDILVGEDQLASTRMTLAARGVKAALPSGFSDLNKMSELGTSQFMENARYVHALEGELARTMMSLDAISSARVHLAIPKRTLFVGREEEKPSASVMVDVKTALSASQVQAIVNLVAGAVPGMKPNAISVVDQKGELLSAGLDDPTNSTRLSVKQMDYTSQLESRIAKRAKDMLNPLLGGENYRVQVAADVDFSTVDQTSESLDGTPVVVDESSTKDNNTDALSMGIPGALSNRPPVAKNQTQGQNNQNSDQPQKSLSQREQSSRKFDTGRSVTHTKFALGRLKHMSVSVLLNNAKAPKGGWTPAQLTEMTNMLKNAVGFDATRGDQFSINTFNFSPETLVNDQPASNPWWRDPVYLSYLRYGLGSLLLLLLLLFGVRPLVKHLTRPPEPVADSRDDLALGVDEEGEGDEDSDALDDETRDLLASLPPPGSELDVQLKHLQLLVDKETTRVTEVVKQWVNGNERTHD